MCGEEERGLVCDVRVSRRLLQRDVRRAQPILYPEQANTHWCLTHTVQYNYITDCVKYEVCYEVMFRPT